MFVRPKGVKISYFAPIVSNGGGLGLCPPPSRHWTLHTWNTDVESERIENSILSIEAGQQPNSRLKVYKRSRTRSIAEGSSGVQTGKCYMAHLAHYYGHVNLEFRVDRTTTMGGGSSKVLKTGSVYTRVKTEP